MIGSPARFRALFLKLHYAPAAAPVLKKILNESEELP
jgi:hypothetical protein